MRILTEVYSRVAGYFRPVNQWNRGKQEEFAQRQNLKIEGGDNESKTDIDTDSDRETKH